MTSYPRRRESRHADDDSLSTFGRYGKFALGALAAIGLATIGREMFRDRVQDDAQELTSPSSDEISDAPIVIESTRLGKYAEFSFPDEKDTILRTAERVGVDPAYLFAIREAEKGRAGFEFGIIPTDRYRDDDGITENGVKRSYTSDLEKQASWAAWSIKKSLERYGNLTDSDRSGYTDFVDFFGDSYCPVGADNDPTGLNKNWETNVRSFYKKFSD